MESECRRIADQLRRAFSGDPWHGDPLRKLLTDVMAPIACARPLPNGHNIWELVLHIELWAAAALRAMRGVPMPPLYDMGKDWFEIFDGTEADWADAKNLLQRTAEELALAIDNFEDRWLNDVVPGRDYDFYYLFQGIVQHSLYHGGQIAMLKRALLP